MILGLAGESGSAPIGARMSTGRIPLRKFGSMAWPTPDGDRPNFPRSASVGCGGRPRLRGMDAERGRRRDRRSAGRPCPAVVEPTGGYRADGLTTGTWSRVWRVPTGSTPLGTCRSRQWSWPCGPPRRMKMLGDWWGPREAVARFGAVSPTTMGPGSSGRNPALCCEHVDQTLMIESSRGRSDR